MDAIEPGIYSWRKRGPRPFFWGDKLKALIEFLSQPDSTIEKAAQEFGCSPSTVEKTIQRVRRQNQDKSKGVQNEDEK